MRIVPLLLVCGIALSAHAQDPASFATNLRAGESINGFPNWAERVVLEWTNRARVAPDVEMQACGPACGDASCYKPVAPLVWSESLNHSARFHSDEMAKQNYFSHDSKCAVVRNINAMYPAGCDGSANCACTSGAATSWPERISLFGTGGSGEIIAGTADPNSAFYLWLYEHSSAGVCGFGSSNGHRYLLLTSTGAVGMGVTGLAVGDFGGGGEPYKIPSAAHYPKQDAMVTLWANWYDAAAPKSASAVVDGKCTSLSLQRGTPQNGAWSATASGVGSGCHRYYFSFVDSAGAEVTYPVTGSLGIGGAGCDDWNSSRVAAKCATSGQPAPSVPARRHAVKRHR
ncbi:MAG TPA: CAP domain-containing protein [Thermoanaerobaculia bacterium]